MGFWNLIVTKLPWCWPILPTRPVSIPTSIFKKARVDQASATKWSHMSGLCNCYLLSGSIDLCLHYFAMRDAHLNINFFSAISVIRSR